VHVTCGGVAKFSIVISPSRYAVGLCYTDANPQKVDVGAEFGCELAAHTRKTRGKRVAVNSRFKGREFKLKQDSLAATGVRPETANSIRGC